MVENHPKYQSTHKTAHEKQLAKINKKHGIHPNYGHGIQRNRRCTPAKTQCRNMAAVARACIGQDGRNETTTHQVIVGVVVRVEPNRHPEHPLPPPTIRRRDGNVSNGVRHLSESKCGRNGQAAVAKHKQGTRRGSGGVGRETDMGKTDRASEQDRDTRDSGSVRVHQKLWGHSQELGSVGTSIGESIHQQHRLSSALAANAPATLSTA